MESDQTARKVINWFSSTAPGMVLMVLGIVGIIMFTIALTSGFGGGGRSTADTLNQICAPHHGVNRIDYPFVICRDGYLSKY